MPADPNLSEIAAQPFGLRWFIVITLAAVGYSIATVGLKLAAQDEYPLATVLILSGFTLATLTEIVLLRRGDLTLVYITIIGAETLMILIAAAVLGETIDLKHLLGAGCVVLGIALCST